MSDPETRLHQILAYLEPRADSEHTARARACHRSALDYEADDRAPLVLYLPYDGSAGPTYSVAEALADPAKLMVNELLAGFTSIYHAVDLRDDAPYCLRPNLGTGLIASMFGAEVRLLADNPPWVGPLGEQRVREIVVSPLPDVSSGLLTRALAQYEFFSQVLAQYPACQKAFQLTLPDLQGPFSTAELLWGGGIYLAVYDHPGLVFDLLARVVELMIAVYRRLAGECRDDLGQGYCYQHGVGTRGTLLVRNDSMINLSPEHYRDIVLPHDAALSEALGGVGMHFCGAGMHQVDNLLSIPALGCLDLGNPEMLDLDRLYQKAAPLCVPIVRLTVPEEDLRASVVAKRFPKGVSLVHQPRSLGHARHLLETYLCG